MRCSEHRKRRPRGRGARYDLAESTAALRVVTRCPDASDRTLARATDAACSRPYAAPCADRSDPWVRPPALKGTQTVCVRLCDGLPFPVGRLRAAADLPIHQAACAAACPGARTELFTLASGRADYEQAVSLTGQSYRSAAYAGLYRRTRVAECACRPAAASGSLLGPGDDRTVREGDVFATEDSADVVTALTPNGPVLTDYREAEIAEKRRRSIEGRVGAIRRDAEAAAFRQVLRLADQRARRIQIAEVRIDRSGAHESVTGFSELPGAGTGFTSVRVVAPLRTVSESIAFGECRRLS
ncbi:DUF2865 domain-containing protein [Methylorubrum suomiense]